MGTLVLNGATSGSTTIAPTDAVTVTATFPNATGTIMVSGGMPAFSYQQASGQSITGGTTTKITFDTKVFDTNNLVSSSRFTPNIAGYYQISWAVASNLVQNRIFASLWKNGSEYARGQDTTAAATVVYSSGGSSVVYCNGSTDYLEIYVYFQSTSNTQGSVVSTFFNGSMIRTS